MYNYIKRDDDYVLQIQQDHTLLLLNEPIQKHLNNLLKIELTTLKSREKTTKIFFKFKAKIPIYIDKNILLMCIKSYRSPTCLYINYHAITSFNKTKYGIIINFKDYHSMKLNESSTFLKQIKKCNKILSHINKESVFSDD